MLLYKYCRPYRKDDVAGKIVEDLLGRLLIRFTQPEKLYFNDPFDCSPEFRANPDSFNREYVKAKSRLQHSGQINIDNWPLEEKILYEGRMNDRRKQRVQEFGANPEHFAFADH